MRQYIENTGTDVMYVQGKAIPPGEGREIEIHEAPVAPQVPAAAAPAPSMDDKLKPLLDLAVDKIVPQLKDLTDAELARLHELEDGGKTRKGVVGAISAEQLHRANEKLAAEEAERVAAALRQAEGELLTARVALDNLPPTATPAEREAAELTVAEAQAKVDALSKPATE